MTLRFKALPPLLDRYNIAAHARCAVYRYFRQRRRYIAHTNINAKVAPARSYAKPLITSARRRAASLAAGKNARKKR